MESLTDCGPSAHAARIEVHALFRRDFGHWLSSGMVGLCILIHPVKFCFSNRSAAFGKLGVFNKTLEDANARVLLEFNGGRVVFAVALS